MLSRAQILRVAALCLLSFAFLQVAHAEEGHDDHDHHDHEEEHHDEHHEEEGGGGMAFAGAAIVHVITLLAVILLLVPGVRAKISDDAMSIARAFAAGALIGAAFLLMLPEAFHLVEGVGSESAVAAAWGLPVLGAIVGLLLLDMLVNMMCKSTRSAPADGVEMDVAKGEAGEEAEADDKQRAKFRLMGSISVGDAMHNFVDGAFIGAAFRLCNPAVGWGVIVGTIAHELSQELADVIVLAASGWELVWCAAANFAAGAMIYVGVAVTLFSDVSPAALGSILALGGGVFVYTAAVECLPSQVHISDSTKKLQRLVAFVFGLIVIGLVLVNHGHCEEGHADEHGGHGDHDGHGH